ncbi:amidohydrolase family protein [Aquibacillus albus]|uniref:Cytosine deaminase n=1 Tax=Aquibacillus albus TaxID=1168171 RepID=A0ABS2MW12_9BACI|nr:amidohydrolase family protein [Aquibacillus albus]MBM7570042.1 cytosine deaminase [Aquibacillus albus]
MSNTYWLTNVRLETGYSDLTESIARTETSIFHLLIEDGKISKIASGTKPLDTSLETVDAKNSLALPAFKEMHIHIDKTYFGGPWQACSPFKNIFTRIEEEQKLLPKLLPTAKERAEKILQLLLRLGVTHVRTHCNIDQVVGLKNLEATLEATESFSDKMAFEIVAFPQHGLLRNDSVQLVRQALRTGANLVGGVDPATVDLDIEKSLNTIMDLAVEHDADIDIHLHDPGHLGTFTIKRLAAMTEEAGWNGRVTISHALGLAGVSIQEAAEIAEQLNELDISIATVASSRATGPLIPIPLLLEKGVNVSLGTDTVMDHWSPFGNGDTLEKLTRVAEYFRWLDEKSLAQSLGLITGGKTPLNKAGEGIWPKIGEEATIVFVNASCSAEAVARRSERKAVMYRGRLVSGGLD